MTSRQSHDPAFARRSWAFPLLLGASALGWTLLMWGGWMVMVIGADLIEAGSGWLAAWPELLYWSQWALGVLGQFGAAILMTIWAFGLLAIGVGGWLGRRLWRGARAALSPVGAAPAAVASEVPRLPPTSGP